MTRDQYIEKLIAIYKLRYKPSELEIAEFRLMLEMMPDASVTLTPSSPLWPKDINDKPFPYETVMYGVQFPESVAYGPAYPSKATYNSSSTIKGEE